MLQPIGIKPMHGRGGLSLLFGNEDRRRQGCSYSLGLSAFESRSRIWSWPMRPADEVYNGKPMLRMKKRHEKIKDATNGRSATVWGPGKTFRLAGL